VKKYWYPVFNGTLVSITLFSFARWTKVVAL